MDSERTGDPSQPPPHYRPATETRAPLPDRHEHLPPPEARHALRGTDGATLARSPRRKSPPRSWKRDLASGRAPALHAAAPWVTGPAARDDRGARSAVVCRAATQSNGQHCFPDTRGDVRAGRSGWRGRRRVASGAGYVDQPALPAQSRASHGSHPTRDPSLWRCRSPGKRRRGPCRRRGWCCSVAQL